MKDKFRYVEQKDRKKILLLCDDIRMHSGIANMGKEIVLGSAHHFNWVNLGAALKHPEDGKAFDLSQQINSEIGIEDSYVRLIPSTGYGTPKRVRELIAVEQPDAILIFTDPRYWTWLFEMEREIRSQIPIFWLNIWDDYPAPMYNKSYYESVDVLMAISKQTKNINEIVLGSKAKNKLIEYVPHGINTKHFFPLKEDHKDFPKLVEFKKAVLKDKDIDFVLFYNSRNIRRKSTADTILAYRIFCDSIGKEKAKKCAFILHTDPKDQHGTDLKAVREAFCDPSYVNVFFSSDKLPTAQLNLLYNMADATILLSSNEGWGLGLTESLMTSTPIIANVTGGMQDQMRFTKDGKWVDFTPDFPSNHRGTIKEHGEWAFPVYPASRSIAGSLPTPYIFDDKCTPEDAALAIEEVYNLSPEERASVGKKGYDWAIGDEANMTAEKMANRVIEVLDIGFDKFTPRQAFDFHKIEDRPANYIEHKLTGY
jgi:glycosyltransferase involved in cell wall biosynthesis